MTLLREGKHKARKKRRCDWCGEWINPGEYYSYYVGVHDGEFQSTGMHMDCYDQCIDEAEDYGLDFEFALYAHDRPIREVRE